MSLSIYELCQYFNQTKIKLYIKKSKKKKIIFYLLGPWWQSHSQVFGGSGATPKHASKTAQGWFDHHPQVLKVVQLPMGLLLILLLLLFIIFFN
jgi:hypothetical protein